MSVLELCSKNGDVILQVEGKLVLGRGALLKITDKRVSRSHATLELTKDKDIILTSTHANPCFVKRQKGMVPVTQNQEKKLADGDVISLLPEDVFFSIRLRHPENGRQKEKDKSAGEKTTIEKNNREEAEEEEEEEEEEGMDSENVADTSKEDEENDTSNQSESPDKEKRVLPEWISSGSSAEKPTETLKRPTPPNKAESIKRQRSAISMAEEDSFESDNAEFVPKENSDSDFVASEDSEEYKPRSAKKSRRKRTLNSSDESEGYIPRPSKSRRVLLDDDSDEYRPPKRNVTKKQAKKSTKKTKPKTKKSQKRDEKRHEKCDENQDGEDSEEQDEKQGEEQDEKQSKEQDEKQSKEQDEDEVSPDKDSGRDNNDESISEDDSRYTKIKSKKNSQPTKKGSSLVKVKAAAQKASKKKKPSRKESSLPRRESGRQRSTPMYIETDSDSDFGEKQKKRGVKKSSKKREAEDSADESVVSKRRGHRRAAKKRTNCQYGHKCYRKNTEHFEEFAHPDNSDWNNESSDEEEPVTRQQPKRNARTLRESLREKDLTSVLCGDVDDDGLPNTYDYDDSFIAPAVSDGSGEVSGEAEEEGSDWADNDKK